MKILVLSNDLTERTAIQKVLLQDGHLAISADNSDNAMQMLQEGDVRFVIADRASTDVDTSQFIKRVREARPPYYIYILVLMTKADETAVTTPHISADDTLRKPVDPLELRSRIRIGERILGLGDSLEVAKDTMERIAMYDPLTGVLNKRAFHAFSRGELERSRRAQSPLSLIALDIDNFAAITDRFGQNIGNDVLIVVAKGIREKSRPYDGVGRYGADTFLIMLPSVIGQDAEKVAERILKAVLNTDISLLDGTNVNVKLSAGIAAAVRITAAMEVDSLIEKALGALQQAKRDGGNQVALVVA
jgi:two-component system chemotaxis response regulator CheY